jgi:hypothetical protein
MLSVIYHQTFRVETTNPNELEAVRNQTATFTICAELNHRYYNFPIPWKKHSISFDAICACVVNIDVETLLDYAKTQEDPACFSAAIPQVLQDIRNQNATMRRLIVSLAPTASVVERNIDYMYGITAHWSLTGTIDDMRQYRDGITTLLKQRADKQLEEIGRLHDAYQAISQAYQMIAVDYLSKGTALVAIQKAKRQLQEAIDDYEDPANTPVMVFSTNVSSALEGR